MTPELKLLHYRIVKVGIMSKKKNTNNFLVQGSILAIASIIVRIIGLIYKIPMTNILGNEGIGYYNTAYEMYNLGLILSSYSLPLAVSKLIAAKDVLQEYQNSQRIFHVAMLFAASVGTIMTLAIWFGADFIALHVFQSPNSALPLMMLVPTILVFSVMGVFRGFFQGKNTMIPTSISQVIEQIVNAVVSVVASFYFIKKYAELPNAAAFGAAGGTFGTFSGAVAAFIFLLIMYMMKKSSLDNTNYYRTSQAPESYGQIFKLLILTIVPIILSQTIYQLSGIIDNSLFNILMARQGFGESLRASLLGIYSGKYRLLTNVPVAIATALGTSMIPSIVTSRVQGKNEEVQQKIYSTIKFNMLIAIPSAVGMGALACPIMQLIFNDNTALTSNLMVIGCCAVVFFSLSTVTNAVLQGVDLLKLSVIHSAISLVIHIILVYILLNFFHLGVYGMVIGNVTFPLVVCILNWIAVGKHLSYKQEIKTTFILPLICSLIMGVAAYVVYHGIHHFIIYSNIISIIPAILIAVLVYAITLPIFKAVTVEDLMDMPLGTKLLKVYKKLHLMK